MERHAPQHTPVETTADTTAAHSTPPTPENNSGFFGEIFRFSLLALIIVLPIRFFVATPFIVSGASMESTFETGQYLIVDQLSYHFDDPHRGDVVIFHYPNDPSKFFIKRVIGIPGDTVMIDGDSVTIATDENPDGTTLSEPYVETMSPRSGPTSQTLGENEYFVMGDNRDASSDSRSWGTLPRKNIVGRAFIRLLPLSTIDLLPGAYDLDTELTPDTSTS